MHVADGDWASRIAPAKARQRRCKDIREVDRVTLSGGEDKRARGPVTPRGIVAKVEKGRTSNRLRSLLDR